MELIVSWLAKQEINMRKGKYSWKDIGYWPKKAKEVLSGHYTLKYKLSRHGTR